MKVRTFQARAKMVALLLAVMMAAPSWLMAQQPQLPDPGSPRSISKQQQEQLGLQAMGEVYQQFPVLPDSDPLTRYVQDLGRRLVSVIPSQYSWPYQFHVIPQKDINAFALPGGPIFINVGTIEAADYEAELVGVMAHEMSHVYMQHTAKSIPKQQFAQVFAGILGAVLPGTAAGSLARLGVQIGAGSILMKYSRKDEAQADAVGAIIAYKAGYNPKALADFFQKLEQQSGDGGPQFLSDHPNPGNRQQAISNEIRNWPPKNFVNNSPTFAGAKSEASRLRVYTAQEIAAGAKQGAWVQYNREHGSVPKNLPASNPGSGANNAPGPSTSGNLSEVSFRQVQPSGRFITAQQNDFSISYPDNWGAQQGNGGLTIAPSAGVSGNALAYGVIVGEVQDANAQSLDQATKDLIQNLQQSNPGLRPSGNAQSIQVNGLRGRSVSLLGDSPIQNNGQPVAESDWLVTLPRSQGGLLYAVFIAPEPDFNRLRPTYQKMLDSLQLR
jgi:beta-barrel assembly-enhancing protease